MYTYLSKPWDQRLRNGEREHQLGAHHKDLGRKTLEERREALIAHHVANDRHTAHLRFEVRVLNTGLDDIQWRRNSNARDTTRNARHKVLGPGSIRVVLQAKHVLLGERTTTEQSERARRIPRRCPAPAAVQVHILVQQDANEAARSERLRVCLALDLEHIEREEDNLTNTRQPR